MAITTVLPLPVAILKAMRPSSGLAASLASRSLFVAYCLPERVTHSVR